jgi:hypothetical protein
LCRDATLALLMLLGPAAIVKAGALPAMASPTPTPAPAVTASPVLACPAPSESTIEQRAVYPDHIAISDASLETFQRNKPNAKYGVVRMITYLDGHVTLLTGGHADFDDAFRRSLIDFTQKVVLTPVIPGCRETAGNVFLMMFTIPDGRVRLAPIHSADDAGNAVAVAFAAHDAHLATHRRAL